MGVDGLQRAALGFAILILAACVQPSRPATDSDQPSASREPNRASKTLTIAQTANIKTYGPWEFASTASGVAALAEIHTTGLATYDNSGTRIGRIAARLPSFEDGSITIL